VKAKEADRSLAVPSTQKKKKAPAKEEKVPVLTCQTAFTGDVEENR